ncbi:MAG: hypothetical protein PHC33_02550 [Candidatus Omnitrophica bacterium]|nr:hypothetical protein [Candidatus Omnitrophota bacterium]
MKLFMVICAAVLALTGGLAASCFVKAFGITFLARPRSRYAENAKEVSFSMKAGMFFLSFLAVAFGLAAGWIIKLLMKVAGAVTGIDTGGMAFSSNMFTVNPQAGSDRYLSSLFLVLVLCILGAAGFLVYRFWGREKRKVYKTWDCGYYALDARNEYTATAFSKPFRVAFGFFLLPYRKTQKIRESFYYVKSFTYGTYTTLVFKKYIYEPVIALVFKSAKSLRRIQPGSIHLYLAYIFSAVLLLILFRQKF